MYVWRSLKRGYNSKDLGISAFKAQRIKLKNQYIEFKESLEKEPLGSNFDKGYSKLRKVVSNFVRKFSIVLFINLRGILSNSKFRCMRWKKNRRV
jgi:hypothetical protein